MPVLPRRFYARDAATVARDLLGKVLVRELGGQRRRARITETEAYVGSHDLASHSRHGPTARNRTMFGPPGHAYVYFVYGIHHCLNAVTGQEGVGEAVLLRAAEPLAGWDARLTGPGLLARAFGVTRADDGLDLTAGPLRILDGPPLPEPEVEVTARIGVAYAGDWAHRPLRFVARPAAGPNRRQASSASRGSPAPAKCPDRGRSRDRKVRARPRPS